MTTDLKKTDGDTITNLSTKYNDAYKKIGERRELWKSSARDKIHKILGNIKDAAKLKELRTQKVLGCENLEAVNIGFYDTTSGIVLTEGSTISAATKHGGCLCFSQTYTGKIYVFIIYPHVDEYVGQMDNKLLGTHEPGDFNTDLVFGYYEKFMNEMIEWETQDRSPVGFK